MFKSHKIRKLQKGLNCNQVLPFSSSHILSQAQADERAAILKEQIEARRQTVFDRVQREAKVEAKRNEVRYGVTKICLVRVLIHIYPHVSTASSFNLSFE